MASKQLFRYIRSIESKTIPINLRALQGAFIALALGCTLAGIVLILENGMLSQVGAGLRYALRFTYRFGAIVQCAWRRIVGWFQRAYRKSDRSFL